jgi:hypothetical protein
MSQKLDKIFSGDCNLFGIFKRKCPLATLLMFTVNEGILNFVNFLKRIFISLSVRKSL